MGGNVNESNANSRITAMDLDQSLLKTTEANAKASTTAADVNVLIDNKHKDYANQLKHLENNEKKASYIMKMLVEDAIKTGRISQNNLLNSHIVQICNILYKAILVLLTKQSSYFERQNLEIINVDMVESQDLPYFSLIYNEIATGLTMFEVSKNIFNVKMREVTEADFRENTEGDRLSVFKTYIYHLFHEYHMSNVDNLIPFRSETKFREATIIRYQNLSPQAQCRNFFIMLDNYLLQLYTSGNTDYSDQFTFRNELESDLNRRFSALVLNFMVQTNRVIEQQLVQTPFTLLLTESYTRAEDRRMLSFRRIMQQIIRNVTNSLAYQFKNLATSEALSGGSAWSMLFHNRENSLYTSGMNCNTDSPPSGSYLNTLLDQYRNNQHANSNIYSVGSEWSQIEPSLLIEILIYAFVEHGVIPPLQGHYSKSLNNFFSVLLADPIQQLFIAHMKKMYRRGFDKSDLARKCCYAFVEHYVGLILLVVQRNLMQDTGAISSTGAFMANLDSIVPIAKMKDLLLSLIICIDPIAYLPEETVNREAHEKRYMFHFVNFSRLSSEIIESHRVWLDEVIIAFDNEAMARREMFMRFIAAGGYEEAAQRTVAKTSIVTNSGSSSGDTAVGSEVKENMEKIKITIKNSGTQTMSALEAQTTKPIVVTEISTGIGGDGSDEVTKVVVDASHPLLNEKTQPKLLEVLRKMLKDEFNVLIKTISTTSGSDKSVNSSNTTQNYVAYASSELSESILSTNVDDELNTINYVDGEEGDVTAEDSASQISDRKFDANRKFEDLSTINYGSGETVLENISNNPNEPLKIPTPTNSVRINETTAITSMDSTKIVEQVPPMFAGSGDKFDNGDDVASLVASSTSFFDVNNDDKDEEEVVSSLNNDEYPEILIDSKYAQSDEDDDNVYTGMNKVASNNEKTNRYIKDVATKQQFKSKNKEKSGSIRSKTALEKRKREIMRNLVKSITEEKKKKNKEIMEANAACSVQSSRKQMDEKKERSAENKLAEKNAKSNSLITPYSYVKPIVGQKRKNKLNMETLMHRMLTKKRYSGLRRFEILERKRKLLETKQQKQLASSSTKREKSDKSIIDIVGVDVELQNRLDRLSKVGERMVEGGRKPIDFFSPSSSGGTSTISSSTFSDFE